MSVATERASSRDTSPTIRLRTVVVVTIVAVLLLLALAEFASPTRVSGRSMEPTLSTGNIILVDRFTPHVRPPQNGDIVLVTQGSDELIKRVVATAGQWVGLADGFLTVDGVTLDEPWVNEAAIDSTYFGPVLVPENSIFVMGDNRGESIDSRYFGSFPLDDVQGYLRLRAWPLG